MAVNTNKYYGKKTQIRTEVKLNSCVIDELSVQPSYIETQLGTPARTIVVRLDNVEYSGKVYFVEGKSISDIETEIETWCESDAPTRYGNRCPTGGSTVVKFGPEQLVGGDNELKAVQFTANYWPLVEKTPAQQ